MNTTLWAVIGGASFTVLVALGGFKAGKADAGLECAAEKAKVVDKIITKQEVVIKEVPKIITRVVTETITTERTYHDAIKASADVFDPSCTMPPWWGELFVATANGQQFDATSRVGKAPARYGCLETATATLKDLSAGQANSARLLGVQQWAQLIGDGKK